MFTTSNSDASQSLTNAARDRAKRRQIGGAALHRVVIDARNIEQGFKAGLAILAILHLGVVDGVVEFSDRPAELDVRLVGGSEGRNWRKENRNQEQSNDGVDHRTVQKNEGAGKLFGRNGSKSR